MAFSREQAFREAREKLKKAYSGKDAVLVHTVNSIEELDKVANLFMERLREWYGIYFPELKVSEPVSYCRIVAMFDRSNLDLATLTDMVGEEKAKEIIAGAKKSVGADFDDADIKEARSLANQVIAIYALRDEISEYQSMLVKKMAPNLCHLVEPALAAKLIAQAGNLERLAKFPASTVQVLGAEKALFKHLKRGTLPPKYGLIFQHPLIGNAPPAHAGKLARALATKLSIASKADAFSHNFIAEKLKASFERRALEISKLSKEKKAGPSKPPQGRPPFAERREGRPPFRPQGRPPFERREERPQGQQGGRPPYERREERPQGQGRPPYERREERPQQEQREGRPPFRPQGRPPYGQQERRPPYERREGRPQGQQGGRPPYERREGRPPYERREERPQQEQREGRPPFRPQGRPPYEKREGKPPGQGKPPYKKREEGQGEGQQGYPPKKRFNKFRRRGGRF